LLPLPGESGEGNDEDGNGCEHPHPRNLGLLLSARSAVRPHADRRGKRRPARL
jgi:hypothetical protein